VVRFQSDAGTGGLLDAVDRLSPLPSELPGGSGWAGGIPRPALSPSDSDNVRISAHFLSCASKGKAYIDAHLLPDSKQLGMNVAEAHA